MHSAITSSPGRPESGSTAVPKATDHRVRRQVPGPRLSRTNLLATSTADGPEMRITATPPLPWGVATAAMVSSPAPVLSAPAP
jgi:hypothetical protein